MFRPFCKSKIQGLVVTRTDLNYVGSVTINPDLARKADIKPYEMVMVLNMANGARVETYYIPGQAGDNEICLNGPAARLFQVGDRIIVISTALLNEEEAGPDYRPTVIITDQDNRITRKL